MSQIEQNDGQNEEVAADAAGKPALPAGADELLADAAADIVVLQDPSAPREVLLARITKLFEAIRSGATSVFLS